MKIDLRLFDGKLELTAAIGPDEDPQQEAKKLALVIVELKTWGLVA